MEEKSTRELLNEWRIDAAVPSNFNSAVWRRIERTAPASLWVALGGWLNAVFARPAVAFSYAVLALAAGLTAGQIHGARDVQTAELQLKSKYIQSIDPYAKPLNR